MKVILISGESGSGKSYLAREISERIKAYMKDDNGVVILPFALFLKAFSHEFLNLYFQKDEQTMPLLKEFLKDLLDRIKEKNWMLINKYKSAIKNKSIRKDELFLYIYSLMNVVVDYLNENYANDVINKDRIYIGTDGDFLTSIIYHSYKENDVRTFYQYFGTDYIRNKIDENFHIKMLLKAIEKAKERNYKYVIVDDLRFPNEKIFMKSVFKEDLLHIHICSDKVIDGNWYKKHESEKYSPILFECADICVPSYLNKKITKGGEVWKTI